MDALETKTIIEQALRDPRNFPFAVYVIVFIVAAVGAYFGAYLRRKGQNFADKEDIKKLTEIVESVRSQYAKDLENLAYENRKVLEYFSQKHQLSLAVIDRRLAAHQDAYSVWLHLAISYHDTIKRQKTLQNCQTFYNANCLYLGNRTRKAFKETMVDIAFYEAAKDEGFTGLKELNKKIEGVFDAIFDDMGLPDMKESLDDIRKSAAKLQ
jgi:hypothetical protein